jgi:hypothetical protein
MRNIITAMALVLGLSACQTSSLPSEDSQPTDSEASIPLMFASNNAPFMFADTAFPTGTSFQLIDRRSVNTRRSQVEIESTPYLVWISAESSAVPYLMTNVNTKLGMGLDENLCTTEFFFQENAFGAAAPGRPYHRRLTPPENLCFTRQ